LLDRFVDEESDLYLTGLWSIVVSHSFTPGFKVCCWQTIVFVLIVHRQHMWICKCSKLFLM